MKIKKPSKRMKIHRKINIDKRVRQYHRKVRRLIKKGVVKPRKAKLPGIPNTWHEKEKLLMEIQQQKADMAREKEERKSMSLSYEEFEYHKLSLRRASDMQFYGDMNQRFPFLADQKKPLTEFERMQALSAIIHMSDVLVLVVDSRDPNASRNSSLEKYIIEQNKKLIMVLNNRWNSLCHVETWYQHLNEQVPTVVCSGLDTEERVGLESLTSLLQLAADKNNTRIVSVIGCCHMGSEDLIKHLKKEHPVKEVKGWTFAEFLPNMQLNLISGILRSTYSSNLCWPNREVEKVSDPKKVVENLYDRIPTTVLQKLLKAINFTSFDIFLRFIVNDFSSKTNHRGKVSERQACQFFLKETAMNPVKNVFFTEPDLMPEDPPPIYLQSWHKDFDFNASWKRDTPKMPSYDTQFFSIAASRPDTTNWRQVSFFTMELD